MKGEDRQSGCLGGACIEYLLEVLREEQHAVSHARKARQQSVAGMAGDHRHIIVQQLQIHRLRMTGASEYAASHPRISSRSFGRAASRNRPSSRLMQISAASTIA